MTLQEAIVNRHSVRQYEEKALPKDIVDQLHAELQAGNAAGGLHLQLVVNEPQAFASGLAKYGKIRGVTNYVALVAPKSKAEEVGYYGERLVLLAQTLGLRSCWVGLTFSRQPDQFQVANGEKLHGVIALGYGLTDGVQHPSKPIEQFVKAEGAMPDWFRRGVEAALLAPTAVNQQKFLFELRQPSAPSAPNAKPIVVARTRFSLAGYTHIDLGIAKLHFELAAGTDQFTWGED